MLDNRDIGREIERVGAGLLALLLLTRIGFRLWYWWAGVSNYTTFLGAVSGRKAIGKSSKSGGQTYDNLLSWIRQHQR